MISPLNDCACALSRTRPQLGDLHPTSFSHGSFPVSPIHDIPIHFCRSALTMINSALDIKRLISSHSCQPGTKRNETEPDKSEVWEFDFRAFVKPNRDKNPNRKGKLECNSFSQCTYRTIRKLCLFFLTVEMLLMLLLWIIALYCSSYNLYPYYSNNTYCRPCGNSHCPTYISVKRYTIG